MKTYEFLFSAYVLRRTLQAINYLSIVVFVACLLLLSGQGFCLEVVKGKPLVLVDVHPNSISAQRIKTAQGFILSNGYDLKNQYGNVPALLLNGISGNGAYERPLTGVLGVGNDDYHEWQLLTLRAANADGMLVEWGFPPEITSADKAMESFKKVVNRTAQADNYPFAVVPLWLPNWTVRKPSHPRRKLKNIYKAKLNRLMKQYYSSDTDITYKQHPLLFVLDFWSSKTLNHVDLRKFFEHRKLNQKPVFIWRMGETKTSRWEASDIQQIVGNFPWLVPRKENVDINEITDRFILNFDRYATREDVKEHVKSVNKLNDAHAGDLPIRVVSVTPGVDTRYAAWSSANSVLRRDSNELVSTFELGWQSILSDEYSKPDIVVVETMDDFSEGTHIEPTISDRFRNIQILGEYTCRLKLDDGEEPSRCDMEAEKTKALACMALKVHKARKLLKVVEPVIDDKQHLDLSNQIDQLATQVFKRQVTSPVNLRQIINASSVKSVGHFRFR